MISHEIEVENDSCVGPDRAEVKSRPSHKILRQDDNTNSLLDYVEQISWLLFLKCLRNWKATAAPKLSSTANATNPSSRLNITGQPGRTRRSGSPATTFSN